MTPLNTISSKPLRAALALGIGLGAAIPAAMAIAPVPVSAAEGDLDAAVAALRGIGSMTADFTQTDRNGTTIPGKLYLKRPGKIRFEYAPSARMLVVSTGKSLYLIDYEVNQVQRWPIGNSPLGALLDPSRDVKAYGTLIATQSPDVVSVEVRDRKRPEFGMINLIFLRDATAPGGLRLTNWVALDSQNNRTTVRLSNQSYGAAIPDSKFTFTDPRRTGGRR
ncbi:MAG: outer-membrane lipoprotein carrier protein LolA [Altererythrobacter sp.]|nr:outer-membrane lipoprotein carrier protein LolA [Altererythrobacter sp.]